MDTIEGHIKRALREVAELRCENRRLREVNAQLKATLGRFEEDENASVQPKRGKKASTQTLSQLRQKIARLEHARKKDKKSIHELRRREANRDASDLLDTNEEGKDQNHEQTKLLLRKFVGLVEKPSLSDAEVCDICMEEIKMSDARSLLCNHILCNACLQQLNPRTCPHCRKSFELDDVEEVKFTATEQWDELLEVATQATRLLGTDDVVVTDSEVESEQPFLNDEDDSASSLASEEDEGVEEENGVLILSPTSRLRRYVTPPASAAKGDPDNLLERSQAYHESPTFVKRKRMEDLAAKRKRRKQI